MAHQTIKSLYQLENALRSTYGNLSQAAMKADAPMLTTTTGFHNSVYGMKAWSQLQEKDTLFGLLPKADWGHSGWRIITARPGTAGQGGTAEGGAINDTVKPTLAIPTGKPKTCQTNFEESEVQTLLAQSKDDAWGAWEDVKSFFAEVHRWDLNKQMNTDVGTLASNNFESIDRIVSAFAEIAAHSLDANDADIHGLDRDAGASAIDAQVLHNSDTNRPLTDALVRQLLANTAAAKANSTLWYGGFDTLNTLQGLYGDQARYGLPTTKTKVTINGVESAQGTDVGLNIGAVYGIPFFPDDTIVKDNSTSGSRLYLLDTSNPEGFEKPRLGIDIAKATRFAQIGPDSDNPSGPLANGEFSNEGVYWTLGETKCRRFSVQGKIEDLQ